MIIVLFVDVGQLQMDRDRDEKAQPRGTGAGAERGWGGFQGANPKEGAPIPARTEQARA